MEANIITKATVFAMNAHKGQMYGNTPYFNHCQQVAEIAIGLGYNDEIVAACLLHDVLEDTPVKYSQLVNEFSEEIAEIVYDVTDELGRNRKERKRKTYPKIKANYKATIVKICDRIANISSSKSNLSLLKMYLSESADFYSYINSYDHPDEVVKAWVKLNSTISELEVKQTTEVNK